MADDSDGILSEIADVVGDVAGEAADELKKFGQTAGSQISGQSGQASQQPGSADISKVRTATGGSATEQSAVDEIKDFGKSFLAQITGHTDVAGGEVAKMAKADNKFSQVESAKVKAKINQIYQEYAAKRAKEQQQQTLAKQQQEKEKVVQLQKEKKQEGMDVAIAQAKTRAEIKNYGAE